MRARYAPLGDDALAVTFEGQSIAARPGETIAAALTAAGILDLRTTQSGATRGIFCGMGVCQDCLVEVNDVPNRRACMTKIEPGMEIRRQPARARLPRPASIKPVPPSEPLHCDVLVVGGGPGGLNAAIAAAEAGVRVMLVDERPLPGGQYYKQPAPELLLPKKRLNDRQFANGRELIQRAAATGVAMIRGSVFNAPEPLALAIESNGTTRLIHCSRLILATGAIESARPVPGWTLPGVMTTGAAQTLLRSYGVLPGHRVLLAGNGPLNLQVACELLQAGATIAAVAEAASPLRPRAWRALKDMLVTAPDLLLAGTEYLAKLRMRRVPVHFGTTILAIEKDHKLVATLASGQRYEVDAVCMGYGFTPATELSRLIGCEHDYCAKRGHLTTRRNDDCRTSIEAVFAVGDGAGFSGARAAEAEGQIAAISAAIDIGITATSELLAKREQARRSLRQQQRFQSALWRLFEPHPPVMAAPDSQTLLCRCEEVTIGAVAELTQASIGTVKRLTRLGMGRCQARYCGPLAAKLLAEMRETAVSQTDFPAPRPPIKPVSIATLARLYRR